MTIVRLPSKNLFSIFIKHVQPLSLYLQRGGKRWDLFLLSFCHRVSILPFSKPSFFEKKLRWKDKKNLQQRRISTFPMRPNMSESFFGQKKLVIWQFYARSLGWTDFFSLCPQCNKNMVFPLVHIPKEHFNPLQELDWLLAFCGI